MFKLSSTLYSLNTHRHSIGSLVSNILWLSWEGRKKALMARNASHRGSAFPQVLKERWGFVNLGRGSREGMGRLQERQSRVEVVRHTVWRRCWQTMLAVEPGWDKRMWTGWKGRQNYGSQMSGPKEQSLFTEMGSYWRFGSWVIASISKTWGADSLSSFEIGTSPSALIPSPAFGSVTLARLLGTPLFSVTASFPDTVNDW